MVLVEIKDLNALIKDKTFFEQPIKKKQEAYEQPVQILKNNHYATGKLLNYLYHQNHHKLIGIDLSRKKMPVFMNKIDFTTRLSVKTLIT